MPYLTTRKNLKLQLSPGLVACYDIQRGNGVGLFWDTTHTRTHTGVQTQVHMKTELFRRSYSNAHYRQQ